MDGHRDGPALESEPRGDLGTEDLLDDLDFEEVVAASERSDLGKAALPRAVRHRLGIGPFEPSTFLDVEEVFGGAVSTSTAQRAPSVTSRAPSARSFTLIVPSLPTPAGMSRKIWRVMSRIPSFTSSSVRFVRTSRTPQLMSYPTPPGETIPFSASKAATPPIGKP